MSQEDFEREFDADALGEFGDDLASAATYLPSGAGAPIPCRVLIEHDVQTSGDLTPVSGATKVITFFKAQVALPLRNDRVTVGSATYVLVALSVDDFSRSVWICRHG